jgi:hypothetical protein
MDSDVFDKYILTSAQRPEMFLSASSHERKSACQTKRLAHVLFSEYFFARKKKVRVRPKGWCTFYFLSASSHERKSACQPKGWRTFYFLSASSHERKSACQPKGWRTFYFLSAKLAKKINNHPFKC